MEIYTDGACKVHTTGLGGWAFVVVENDKNIFEEWGNEVNTTNNVMELTAMEKALRYALNNPHKKIRIVSDSKYCVDGYNSWSFGWAKGNWTKDIKNPEIWKRIHELRADNIEVEWVKGHNGNKWNEYCDRLTQKVDKLVEANTRIIRKPKKIDDDLYPVFFDGKYWEKKDCYDTFVVFYRYRDNLDSKSSVYVDGDRIQPDGTWIFN